MNLGEINRTEPLIDSVNALAPFQLNPPSASSWTVATPAGNPPSAIRPQKLERHYRANASSFSTTPLWVCENSALASMPSRPAY